MSLTGTIKASNPKGFGFIGRDDGQGDVFCHPRGFTNGGPEDLIVGTKVTFDVEPDEKSGKSKAVNVTITERGTAPSGGGGGGGFGGASMKGTGTLRAVIDGKGFGFIERDDGQGDLFCATRDVTNGGDAEFQVGVKMSFDIVPDDKNPNKAKAKNVQIVGGGGGGGYGAAPGGYGGYQSSPYGMAPPGGGGLPPGWEVVFDAASGKNYYCNRATGQSSWEPPASGPPPLPFGWEAVPDPASGKTYYCNRSTGQSSWEVPR